MTKGKYMRPARYRLNVTSDVDQNADGYFLFLPLGWRFFDDQVHCRNFDTMRELRRAVKADIIKCDCKECSEAIANRREP
jgi:hypothetical protein